MKKRIKKGFTLVELLVVIAILAILATVSVVGYTSFIDRANESVAQQELIQIRDAVKAEDILDDTFKIEGGKITFKTKPETESAAIDQFKSIYEGLNLGLGDISIDVADVDDTNYTISKIKYTKDGVTAIWDLSDDKVSS